jgi:hypothetical protein
VKGKRIGKDMIYVSIGNEGVLLVLYAAGISSSKRETEKKIRKNQKKTTSPHTLLLFFSFFCEKSGTECPRTEMMR